MKNKKSRKIIILIIIIAVIGAGAALVKIKKARLSGAPKYGMSPMVVHVEPAEQGEISVNLDYLSVVEAFQKADLSSRASANVVSVNVDEGSLVKKGDKIIEMDSKDIHADIDALTAQIKQTEADLAANDSVANALEKSLAYYNREAERDMELAKSGAIPEATAENSVNKADEIKGQHDAALEKAKALTQAVKSLEMKKSQIESQLSYYVIRAPFDGIISRRMVDPGDLATPGRALVTIEDTSSIKLSFDVPQKDMNKIKEGLPVTFKIGDKIVERTLSHLYPSLSVSRMAHAEIYIDSPDKEIFPSGTYVPVKVQVSKMKDIILIPSACLVVNRDAKPYVYVAQDNHINIRSVEILEDNGQSTAIKGVRAGEQVVVNTFLGWAKLSEGMEVEVIK